MFSEMYMEFVLPSHKPLAILCQAVYQGVSGTISGFTVKQQYNTTGGATPRVVLFENASVQVLVFRGTQDRADVLDDIRLTLGESTDIEREGLMAMKDITKPCIATGHSLGGFAALKFSEKTRLPSVVFNAAASALNPMTMGPGPAISIAYHIVGDLISSHMGPLVSTVVRIDTGLNFFQTLQAHTITNFTTSKPGARLVSAGDENTAFSSFVKSLQSGANIAGEFIDTAAKLGLLLRQASGIPGAPLKKIVIKPKNIKRGAVQEYKRHKKRKENQRFE
jgi:hypothetical protein